MIDPGRAVGDAGDRALPGRTHPTLIDWGDHDRIIPLDHALRRAQVHPQQPVGGDGGVGHYPQSEDPVRFVEILRDFLCWTEPSKFDSEKLLDLLRQGPRDEVGLTKTASADPSSPAQPT